MADTKVQDMTAVTALEATDVLYVVDDPAGTPLDRKVTVANLHLQINASTPDANVTGALGVLDVVTMSSMTANRDYTLPTTAAVGDRCGVAVVDGDDTYELLIKSGAAGDKINNVDHSTNEWSRLFIAGERVTFVCIDAAGPHWLVENDGRIPCKAQATRDAAQSISNSVDVKIDFDNENFDIGDIFDITTNNRIDIRRDSYCLIDTAAFIPNLDAGERVTVLQYKNGSLHRAQYDQSAGANIGAQSSQTTIEKYSAGDYIELWLHQQEGASQNTSTTTGYKVYMGITEVL